MTSTEIKRFGHTVATNISQKKWLITMKDYLDNRSGEADPIGWATSEDNASDYLMKISNDLETTMKGLNPRCIVTWEKHLDDQKPSVKLYIERAGTFYGHQSRQNAYLVEVVVLSKLVEAPVEEEEKKDVEEEKKDVEEEKKDESKLDSDEESVADVK